MGGRGGMIQVRCLDAQEELGYHQMQLPVAMHAPLSVLKDLLATQTNIPPRDQVLILCDLDDPDRNNDILLEENATLIQLGIRYGSVLTLHALGMDSALALEKRKESLKKPPPKKIDPSITHLNTRTPCTDADHSYNGIIFDVKSRDAHEIEVTSVHLAGMLGHVRIFARDRPWGVDNERAGESSHYWAWSNLVSTDGWEMVASVNCRPSWDHLTEVVLSKPFRLLPHQRKALYCHSNMPDDLGIQYQSMGQETIFGQDAHVQLIAGLGHTGSIPFDGENGWYRNWRGLAGRVSYRKSLKGWSPFEHSIFPSALKQAVKAMLLTHNRIGDGSLQRQASLDDSISSERVRDEENAMIEADDGYTGTEMPELARQESFNSTISTTDAAQGSASDIRGLARLPRGAVYRIMEFCHWDWFAEAEPEPEEEAQPEPAAREGERMMMMRNRLVRFIQQHYGADADEDGTIPINAEVFHHLMAMQAGTSDQGMLGAFMSQEEEEEEEEGDNDDYVVDDDGSYEEGDASMEEEGSEEGDY